MGAWTERPPSAAMTAFLPDVSLNHRTTGPDECCWRVGSRNR